MRVTCSDKNRSVWYLTMLANVHGEIVVDLPGMTMLDALLEEADTDERCRAIVLEGSGGSFCRGMDLSGVCEHDSSDEAQAGVAAFAEVLKKLRCFSKPTVSLVQGVALAGGLGLLAATDLVIATKTSTFGLSELMLGLVPAMVLPLLMERMPVQKVRYFAMSPLSIPAAQALEMGLVDRLAEQDNDAEQILYQELKNLLRLSPDAVMKLKRFSREILTLDVLSGIENGRVVTTRMIQCPEVLLGLRGFLAGESPAWFERPVRRKKEACPLSPCLEISEKGSRS